MAWYNKYDGLSNEEIKKIKEENHKKYREQAFLEDKYWNRKKERQREGNIRYFSISKKLKRENKTNEEFEAIFNSLSLEEVIGLKLELASRNISGKLYNLPLWRSLLEVVKEAVLKYAYSASRNKIQMIHFLGMRGSLINTLLWKYNIQNYFFSLKEQKETNEKKLSI